MRVRSAAVALLVLGLATACGGSDEGSSAGTGAAPQSPVVQAALNEPALTWYTSQDPARNDAVVSGFVKKYPGVEVTPLRLASGALATRYSQERNSGINNAGLVTLASPALVQEGLDKDWFEEFPKTEFPELASLSDDFFKEGVVTSGISVFGIAYNTNSVKTPPREWQDVTKPEFKGKIIFGDPRNVPSYVALGRVWLDSMGPSFLQGLEGQDLKVVDSMVPGIQQLAAGEGQLGVPGVATVIQPLLDKGAPLGFVVPDVTTGNEFQSMVAKGAGSPSTGRLLYEYLLTPEGQEAFNGSTSSSAFPDVPGTQPLPKGYVAPRIEQLGPVQGQVLSLLGLGG